MKLADVDNRKAYTIAQLKTADLNMSGLHTRTFRWVFGPLEISDFDPVIASTKALTPTSAFKTEKESNAFTPKAGGKFGLPPQ